MGEIFPFVAAALDTQAITGPRVRQSRNAIAPVAFPETRGGLSV